MYLGIEFGGTKIQVGVGRGADATLAALERFDVDIAKGAAGILASIEDSVVRLAGEHDVRGVGIGFGGPVDADAGRVVKSHQVEGWEGFDFKAWCRQTTNLPLALGNDCDVAALAEARLGAGKHDRRVFYVTVGTGIGGGYVVDGQPHGAGRPSANEIGHVRVGPESVKPGMHVESIASGTGIETAARALNRLDWTDVTAREVGEAAKAGDADARAVLAHAVRTLGWAIAQMINLVSPDVVVVGGGVPLMGEELFYEPLRERVAEYLFPPLAGTYRIVAPALGEAVVVHGALTLAAGRFESTAE